MMDFFLKNIRATTWRVLALAIVVCVGVSVLLNFVVGPVGGNVRNALDIVEPDDFAPGWHAIDAVCDRLYPDQPEPLHVASCPHPPIGDGLIYGISAYRAKEPAHWHFVTYGSSELYAKESDNPQASGWGFELTFGPTRGREKQPPNWAFDFLMNLGKYVRQSGNPCAAGHWMNTGGAIAWGTDTAIRGSRNWDYQPSIDRKYFLPGPRGY